MDPECDLITPSAVYKLEDTSECVLFCMVQEMNMGRDSSVSIATRYGLDGPRIESWLAARFSAPVQTDPGAHPASYTVVVGSFPGDKVAGAWP
jgi:hypothetical protein